MSTERQNLMPLTPEGLSAAIRAFGRTAMDSRQVARRLEQLLPSRLQAVHTKRFGRGSGRQLQAALAHPDYVKSLEELIEIQGTAREARIQYETHFMMLEALRSMRIRHSRRK